MKRRSDASKAWPPSFKGLRRCGGANLEEEKYFPVFEEYQPEAVCGWLCIGNTPKAVDWPPSFGRANATSSKPSNTWYCDLHLAGEEKGGQDTP